MKSLLNIIFLTLVITSTCFGQDATYNNITIGNLTKSGGAGAIFGWGNSPDNSLDPRPNFRAGAVPFMINQHTGLTLSAHSLYGGIRFYNQAYPNPYDPTGSIMVMSIVNGSVGIGTTTPSSKLAVNGNIKAKEIKVEIANWPDYVFTNSYKLPTLRDTEKYINEKGHLPGIPSAGEVEKNGVELGDMNKKLLQKIEELTLYLIEVNKKAEQQQHDIEYLKSKLK